jgi:hypothetical protein
MRRIFALLLPLVFCITAFAQKSQFAMRTPSGEAPGPWIFGTIGVGKAPDGTPATTALKGLALKLGDSGEAAICYDLDLCRAAGGWSGGKFVTPMNLMSRGEYPTAMGEPAFLTAEASGFQGTTAWRDPRPEPFGPLPEVRYGGLYLHGNKAILKWRAGSTEVLESPSYEKSGEREVFSRTFRIGAGEQPLRIAVCRVPAGASVSEGGAFASFTDNGKVTGATGAGLPAGAAWRQVEGQLFLEIPPRTAAVSFRLLLVAGGAGTDSQPLLAEKAPIDDLSRLLEGGPAHWPDAAVAKGTVSAEAEEAYVVDTIPVPDANPWSTPMFLGGFDFFPDGRAAVCTFHGDVFIVSGIDAGLEQVRWKRFASGLYHALGLKIVKGEIYVTGRDGLTPLRDLNGDGEADFYEVFNWDVKVTRNFHEFVFDLQTDTEGNFLFAKAGPVKNGGRGFDQICEHHGCLLQVTPDGKKLSVFATGFRAPNGLGTGPTGEITTGDNEGTWTPVCKINWVHPHGFYGVVDLAHWPQPPRDYDRPICWLPKRVDNSSGSQVWATSNRWGPWQGRMLHLSYGQCALFGVMMEPVEIPEAPDCCAHLVQGGVTRFPLKFQSGIMRARFNPADGQLYVLGLRGWQTSGLKNGCFQRVRYTGAPARMPIVLSARKGGIELKFTCSLDTQRAADPENWSVEAWNYLWSSAYGSPELSTLAPAEAPAEEGKDGRAEFTRAQMGRAKHDELKVTGVSIGTDDRTVFLEIPELKPVMQMSIKYQIGSADGRDLDGEVVNTIHGFAE